MKVIQFILSLLIIGSFFYMFTFQNSNIFYANIYPNPTFGNLTATTPVCSGGNAEFTLTGTPNATVTYTINSGANQTVVLDATGNGTVTVNAVTANTVFFS